MEADAESKFPYGMMMGKTLVDTSQSNIRVVIANCQHIKEDLEQYSCGGSIMWWKL